MYRTCDVCGQTPDIFNRAVLAFNDNKDKAELWGCIKCIDEIDEEFTTLRKNIKKKNKKKKIVSVKEQFEKMELDIENYRI